MQKTKRNQSIQVVARRSSMKAKAARQFMKFLRPFRQFGEYTHLHCTQQGLRRPESQADLHDMIRCRTCLRAHFFPQTLKSDDYTGAQKRGNRIKRWWFSFCSFREPIERNASTQFSDRVAEDGRADVLDYRNEWRVSYKCPHPLFFMKVWAFIRVWSQRCFL